MDEDEDASRWSRKVVATWDEWRFGNYRCFKTTFDGPWNFADERGIILTDESLQDVMEFAEKFIAHAKLSARPHPTPKGHHNG